jgi:prepilin-type N-terminal cleavage/methylation domain-containing protein
MKNLQNKKKGFTLVELLAVIAILAIIGAVLIPNLMGFKDKAHKSNIQASAKAVVSTAKNYATEVDKDPLAENTQLFEYANDHVEFKDMLDLDSMKTRDAEVLLKTPMNRLKDVAQGDIKVKTSNGKVQMTIGSDASPIESVSDNDDDPVDSSVALKSDSDSGSDEN